MAVYQGIDQNGNAVTNALSPTTTEKLTLAGSSLQFAANTSDQVQVYRLIAEVKINYLIGTNPTATTSTVYLPADTGEQILLFPGDRLAAIGVGAVYFTSYKGVLA